ncbi:RND family efflux transporter MFP subunit [Sphingobium sp. B1D7B]|uniref:efflux RND transporter periplasmic adaptor subunit n=1 Tax=unclassified Sphingobium TaxID=2611147 RepID=UPI0022243FA0|nr:MULTISPECIES: efflux RND transporter periplasmic adaptor subunit [unclassified Sphingobium]MCW2349704.1 RND family efflux transporter MFP subunit [Sphingobium sp. B12D2B]MCW2367130.1 RND family efflux transporter MFP subunit [Sphingobium sp. B7D2B]MCW2368808.1 RND family efflux transporter MFP subunit [Sphingobium sp. B11D3D]MCW2406713.1 RND family efflux transporter MFP subunit [Sphingobium sp. B1D7B]
MNYEANMKYGVSSVDPEEAESRQKRRRLLLVVGALVALAVIAMLAYRFFGGSGDQGEQVSQVAIVTVAVPAQEAVTRTANATGSLAARVDMPVGVVGEGGRVVAVHVQPGDWVGANQILATIERSVQAQQISQLEASVQVARADAKLAQNNLDRAKALVSDGFVSRADIDQKTATRDAAVARVNVAVAQLNQMRAQVGRLDIRAPAAGLVLTRSVEPGQVVSGGSGVLFRIARAGEMEMKALLSEDELALLSEGAVARVTPVGMTQSFEGRVWQIAPVIDQTSRQGIVRIAVPYNAALRPGGFANAEIAMERVSAAVLPESAIQSDPKGSYVYVVGKDNKVERRSVKTGAVTTRGIAVVQGLNGSERVVLYAGGFLSPGETVKPRLAKSATDGRAGG